MKKIAEAFEQFSQTGFRTMCLAWRDLEENEYNNWSKRYKDANTSVRDREVCEVCNVSVESHSQNLKKKLEHANNKITCVLPR